MLGEQPDSDGGGSDEKALGGGIGDEDDRGTDGDATQRARCCRQRDRAPGVDLPSLSSRARADLGGSRRRVDPS